MLGTLLQATALVLVLGSTSLWMSSGAEQLPGFVLVFVISPLAGVLLILKRQGRRAIPAAAIFVVLMVAVLFFTGFQYALRQGPVEF